MLGRACVSGPHRVETDGRVMTPRRLVLATGSRPAVPDVPGLGQVPYLTNETVFDLRELPRHLAVLGGGAVGCELALVHARFGVPAVRRAGDPPRAR